jgi:hypothetical protein
MAFRLDGRSLSLYPDSESRASVSSNLPSLYAPPHLNQRTPANDNEE